MRIKTLEKMDQVLLVFIGLVARAIILPFAAGVIRVSLQQGRSLDALSWTL